MPGYSFQDVKDLAAAGRDVEAVEACEHYLADNPDDAEAWHLSARLLLKLARYDDAAFQLQAASSIRGNDPEFVETHREIECAMLTEQGQTLQRLGRYTEAAAAYQKTAEHFPDRPWPVNNLGNVHLGAGRTDEAIAAFRRAAFMREPIHVAHSNLLMAMLHSDRVTPEELLAEHKLWAERFTPAHDSPPPVIVDPDPGRPIRVGYVSPDLRNHPIAVFMLPVLSNHDRSRFQVTCYDDSTVDDSVKRQLQATGCRWVPSAVMTYEQLFTQVRKDRIDILIDLAVHSASNRLPVFAARAAPIQMTWLGYAGSTGCPAVDYRITDPIVDPPGLTERHFTETLLRLPETFWCFGPPAENDLPVRTPTHGDGRLRIGTATRLAKVSPACRDAWAELLRRADQSVLVLAAEPFGDDAVRQEWIGHFVSRGIPVERIELLPARGYRGYLELLGSMDIGLDTYPFNGGTTVCQSLWMGTPVVGLAGDTSVSRVTASILTNAGLTELVANSVDEWIELNLRLAAESQRREELRASLRSRMAASPLCDAPRFVRNLESAFRRVFAERCRGEVTGGA